MNCPQRPRSLPRPLPFHSQVWHSSMSHMGRRCPSFFGAVIWPSALQCHKGSAALVLFCGGQAGGMPRWATRGRWHRRQLQCRRPIGIPFGSPPAPPAVSHSPGGGQGLQLRCWGGDNIPLWVWLGSQKEMRGLMGCGVVSSVGFLPAFKRQTGLNK